MFLLCCDRQFLRGQIRIFQHLCDDMLQMAFDAFDERTFMNAGIKSHFEMNVFTWCYHEIKAVVGLVFHVEIMNAKQILCILSTVQQCDFFFNRIIFKNKNMVD